MKKTDDILTKSRHKVIDQILIAGNILGWIAYIAIFSRDYPNNIGISFYVQTLFLCALTVISINIKKVSYVFKAFFIVAALWLIMTGAMRELGYFASSKFYVVLGPVLASFVIPYRMSLVWLGIFIATYSTYAYLFLTGTIPLSITPSEHLQLAQVWITESLILLLICFTLLYVTRYYQKEINHHLNVIGEKNNSLEKSREKFKKLVSAFPDIVMISDLSSNIIYGNEQLEKITGIKPEHYTSNNRAAHIHPEDIAMVHIAIQELLEGKKEKTELIENRFYDMEGNMHWFSGTMTLLNLDGKKYIQTVSRDITEKKQTELELEQYRNNLEKLVYEKTKDLERAINDLQETNSQLNDKNSIINQKNEELEQTIKNLQDTQSQLLEAEKMASLGIITAGVAHEINNPLNYIKGAFLGLEDYFEEHGSKDDESTDFLLQSIQIGVERTVGIVKSLNQFSRDNNSYNEDCNIHEIIDNCLLILNNKFKSKIDLKKIYTEDNSHINGNIGKLHQVFINILSNAEQAIEEKGSITISTETSTSELIITVSDTGGGIDKENLAKLTEPFFTTKPPGVGTGLGLSITNSIISAHNGSITFQSEKGKGTDVIIIFPTKSID